MLNTVTLPIGETITLTYSPCNSMLPSTIGDTLFSYSYSEDCKSGLLSSVIDPNSNVWTYTYNDPMFRLTNFATPLTTASYTDSNTYTYTPTSFDSKMTFNGGNSVYESLYTADTLGRIVLTQQGYNSTQYTTVQVGYNTDGLQTTQSEPFLSAAGTKGTGLTNATFTYDSLARPIKIVGTNGQTQTIAYNGRDILTTMGGYITQTEVNGLGWVTSVCEVTSIAGSGPCGQDNAQTGFLTTYTYNADGRVMQVVHNANTTSPQTISLTYDGIGRVLTVTRPENGQIKYTWDHDPTGTCPETYTGSIVRLDDAAGNVSCETFDIQGRLLTEIYPSGPNAAATPSKTYVYDTDATFTCPNGANQKDRLAEMYAGPSTAKLTDTGYCYSKRGDLTDVFEVTSHSGGYFHTQATYWPDGSINTLSGVPGISTAFTYTPAYAWGNTVTGPGGTLISGVTSNNGVLPTTVTYGSGDTDAFNLDSKLNFSGLTSVIGGQTVSTTWTLNANTTPKTLTVTNPSDSVNGTQTWTYGYDALIRMTSAKCVNGANNEYGQTFSYDILGNMKKNIPTGFTGQKWTPTYNLSTNQMTGSTSAGTSSCFHLIIC
jgi:hypothetical protein